MREGALVAVSGAGGGVGQSIIKALQGSRYSVVAFDADALGAGLYAVAHSYVVPRASDPDFLDRSLAICKETGCELFFPGLDAELPVLSAAVDEFASIGTRVVVSEPSVIELCDDKFATYEFLTRHGITAPLTVDLATSPWPASWDYPIVLKKRRGGSRSQDLHVVEDEASLHRLVEAGLDLSLFVAQEHIVGDEYTCGSINFEGECLGVIIMRRVLRDGDTYKCFVVRDDRIEAYVRSILSALKPFGPCNVQLRLSDGEPCAFEINCRCSGTTAARALCGFNEPLLMADLLCSGTRPSFTIVERTVLRYWSEVLVDDADIETMRHERELHLDRPATM